MQKAVYFLCDQPGPLGRVARPVWTILGEQGLLSPAGLQFCGREVMAHRDGQGNVCYFVPTQVPVCWDYPRYLPEMNAKFGDCQMAGLVTWHEGASAPPRVLTVHSIGDVPAGVFGPAAPRYMRNLLLALERGRRELGLADYHTSTEATHWSGTHAAKSAPALLLRYPVPMVDIEVGSGEAAWSDPDACRALAGALTQVFQDDGARLHNLLCVGGVHFEPSFAQAALTAWAGQALAVTHILANQWLVSGAYEGENGPAFLRAAAGAVAGGVEAIAFHDKLKGCCKDLVRSLGQAYQIPVYRHQRLRAPAELSWPEGEGPA